MAPTPTSQLRSLFEAAMEYEPEERVAFLDSQCIDADIRARLERMLAVEPGAGGAIPAVTADVLAQAIGDIETTHGLAAGSRIGAFELLAVLGEGGSSTVFRAKREIDGVRQEVALKVLHRGLHSPDAQRQFRHERLALTQLTHPGIARLIEGGVTEHGLAYIALDLVEGAPITHYAIANKLEVRARLKLFLQVCRAVEAAHRALIVHRDLKPTNVLVTNDGQVKLLDFGIAKLLDTDDPTETRVPAFTPAYAAPEQRSGEPITTATDVYALGLLLGELLTGVRPNADAKRTTNRDDRKPATPSNESPVSLRGDLDTIVRKAISAEPERRYVSAGALADDIDRYLSGQPVVAHPPSRWYRMNKFVRRHQRGVAMVAVFATAIFVSFGFTIREARIAHEQARHARNEAEKSQQVSTFVGQMLTSVDPNRAKTMDRSLIRLMLDSAAKNAQQGLANVPEKREAIEELIASSYSSIGEYGLTDTHLLAAIQAATDAKLDNRVQLRLLSHRIGALDQLGRYAEARTLSDQALVLIAALPEEDKDRLSAETSVAILDCVLFRRERCRERLMRIYPIQRRVFGDDSPETLRTLEGLIASNYAPGRYAEGKQLGMDLVARLRQRYGADDSRTIAAMTGVAINEINLKEYHDAEAMLSANLPTALRVLGDDHPNTVEIQFWLGDVLRLQRRFTEARPLLEHSFTLLTRINGPDHFETISAETALAQTLMELGDTRSAEPHARALVEKMKEMPAGHGDHGASQSILASVLIAEHRYEEAERELDAAYASESQNSKHTGNEPSTFAQVYVALYTAWGKPDLATRWREKLPADVHSD